MRMYIDRLAPQDGVVVVALVAWWLLAPLQDDDGWVRARQMNSVASGGFSNYYEHWGANLPLATWLEWLQHFVVTNTSALALHRLPAVTILLGTWFVCRSCLGQLVTAPSRGRGLALWACSLAFVLGAIAFGVTMRPEPAIAFLASVVLASCLRYLATPALQWLAIGLLVGALAVTIHPSGVVALAPLVVCVPRIVRDARARAAISPLALASLLPIGLGWALLLAFVDADVSSRDDSVALIRAGGSHGGGLFQELQRYAHLDDAGASPLRRLFVVSLILAVAALLVGLSRPRSLADRLPAASVAVGLLLLTVTPSKWIWHFGTFVGLCAIAVGVETWHLANTRVGRVGHSVAATAVLLSVVWASAQANTWGPLDTGRLDWARVPGPFLVTGLIACAGTLLAARIRLIRHASLVMLPAVAGSLVGLTIFLFAIDTIVTDGWTAARQTTSSLLGREGCGVASDLDVAIPSPAADLVPARIGRAGSSRWYKLPSSPIGILVGGLGSSDALIEATWGRRTTDGVRSLHSGAVDLRQKNSGSVRARWRFVQEERLPARPPGADRVRFTVGTTDAGRRPQIVGPTRFMRAPLSTLLDRAETRALVSPYLFEAMPCARIPRLALGTAELPDLLVDLVPIPMLTSFSSPVAGISDVVDLVQIPVRSPVDRGPVYVYQVLRDPRDSNAPPLSEIISR